MTMPSWMKNQSFQAAADSPGGWLLMALPLKVAAERLDWLVHPVRQEERCLSLMPVYRMMMGMSLENLLKGILAEQGLPVLDKKGRLSKDYGTHNLATLAGKVTALTFTNEELQVLAALSEYIKWAGKFPLPRICAGGDGERGCLALFLSLLPWQGGRKCMVVGLRGQRYSSGPVVCPVVVGGQIDRVAEKPSEP